MSSFAPVCMGRASLRAPARPVPMRAVVTVARAPVLRGLPSKLSAANWRARSVRVRPAVSTQEPVDVEDDADEMAEDSGTNAKGPLRKARFADDASADESSSADEGSGKKISDINRLWYEFQWDAGGRGMG